MATPGGHIPGYLFSDHDPKDCAVKVEDLPAYMHDIIKRECARAGIRVDQFFDRNQPRVRGAVWSALRSGETPSGKPMTITRLGQLFGYNHTTVHHYSEKHIVRAGAHLQRAYERSRREWRIENSVHYPNMLAPGDIT